MILAFAGLLFALSLGAIGLATLYLGKIIQMALNTDKLTASIAALQVTASATLAEIQTLKDGTGEVAAQAAVDDAQTKVDAVTVSLGGTAPA